MTDDSDLLRCYAEDGSEIAFSSFVERHLPFVYATALRRTNGDEQAAVEVAQLVFTNAARRAASLVRHTAVSGWLYVATRNAAFNLRRSTARRRAREHEAHFMNELLIRPEPTIDWEALRPSIDEALDALSVSDREAVLTRFFENQSFAIVGARLRLSENAARMRVERALGKLRAVLARRGITSTTSALAAALANQPLIAVPPGLATTVIGTALTSAGTAGTTASILLQIMSTTKTVTAVATTIAILAVGCAVFEARQAREDRAMLSSVSAQRDQAQRRASTLEAQVRELDTRSPRAPTTTAEGTPARGAPSVSSIGSPNVPTAEKLSAALRPSNPLGSLYALRDSPEAMEAWLKAQRSALDLQLGPLFRSLGLSEEQKQRFKAILMEKFQAVADITGTAQSQGLTMSDSAIKASFKSATDKAEDDLRTLLGQKGYEQLRYFDATSSVREIVKSLASNTSFTDAPLNASQADSLVSLIVRNSAQNSSGYNLDSTNWQNVLADVPGFLAPAQIAMFQAEIDQLRLRQELDRMTKSPKPP